MSDSSSIIQRLNSLAILALIFLSSITLVTSYNLLDSSTEAERKLFCQSNRGYCSNVCSANPSINLCDLKTMKWDCVCQPFTLVPVSYNSFPIEAAQCKGELQECTRNCLAKVVSNQVGSDDGPSNSNNNVNTSQCVGECNTNQRCGSATSNQLTYFYYDSTKSNSSTTSSGAAKLTGNYAESDGPFYALALAVAVATNMFQHSSSIVQ